ncbi:putative quinol monooxygenase [Pseudomonas sp. DTU_2021_1001937_2_SI_NGA_ILE_001]|uniref:putative quinol monooxygenase n=1 Tax=Pseudomonas sp. DTU_2021_1001937_2_SI_NGA_ILE_001 TaxID=3077589 RepID=UPI0025E6C340|nr:putative quinol monooxygenase [Pseudomonas sp. DTU_2021_1001937_2_SI_NGA_ILE_001]WNW13263.1 putative quinol monooxygenase [Pseudomonas sp. DTU_2021_1001937_2_SI_NGA_ILE_001]
MSEPVSFILHAYTRPEKSAEFEALFRGHLAASRQEPGCIQYHMLRDREDPTLFIFFETWASQADLDVHSALPHMKAFFEQRMDYLTRDFEFRFVSALNPAPADAAPTQPYR